MDLKKVNCRLHYLLVTYSQNFSKKRCSNKIVSATMFLGCYQDVKRFAFAKVSTF